MVKRKFFENVSQERTYSGEYAPIPLNIVCSKTLSLFSYINKHLKTIFWDRLEAKYTLKRNKLHHFLKISLESMPPNPFRKRVALPRAAWPHFLKTILNPTPPPPGNEILDTPLSQIILADRTYLST